MGFILIKPVQLVAIASREDLSADKPGKPGNTMSLIDVEKALNNPAKAEVARLLPGTVNPAVGTRPFVAAFTLDSKRIVVTHFRTNNISMVDVAKAPASQPAEIKRLTLETPDGKPSRSAAWPSSPTANRPPSPARPRADPHTRVVWLVNLDSYQVTGRVAPLGKESLLDWFAYREIGVVRH
jgi:DNA-binding beta-propeller fold protein YncE